MPIYGGTGACSSDRRLKKSIVKLAISYEDLQKLQGVSYSWRVGRDKASTQIGLIAQDVQAVFPGVVSRDKYGFLKINYQLLSIILIEMVKKANKPA